MLIAPKYLGSICKIEPAGESMYGAVPALNTGTFLELNS